MVLLGRCTRYVAATSVHSCSCRIDKNRFCACACVFLGPVSKRCQAECPTRGPNFLMTSSVSWCLAWLSISQWSRAPPPCTTNIQQFILTTIWTRLKAPDIRRTDTRVSLNDLNEAICWGDFGSPIESQNTSHVRSRPTGFQVLRRFQCLCAKCEKHRATSFWLPSKMWTAETTSLDYLDKEGVVPKLYRASDRIDVVDLVLLSSREGECGYQKFLSHDNKHTSSVVARTCV